MARFLRAWIPVAAYSGFIWFMSSLSQPPLPPGHYSDKTLHFWGFFVYGIVVYHAFAVSRARFPALLAMLVASFWGACDELHQSFVPGRDASAIDWIADTSGALVAVALAAAFVVWRKRRS